MNLINWNDSRLDELVADLKATEIHLNNVKIQLASLERDIDDLEKKETQISITQKWRWMLVATFASNPITAAVVFLLTSGRR